jgi:hypothetical protein
MRLGVPFTVRLGIPRPPTDADGTLGLGDIIYSRILDQEFLILNSGSQPMSSSCLKSVLRYTLIGPSSLLLSREFRFCIVAH